MRIGFKFRPSAFASGGLGGYKVTRVYRSWRPNNYCPVYYNLTLPDNTYSWWLGVTTPESGYLARHRTFWRRVISHKNFMVQNVYFGNGTGAIWVKTKMVYPRNSWNHSASSLQHCPCPSSRGIFGLYTMESNVCRWHSTIPCGSGDPIPQRL